MHKASFAVASRFFHAPSTPSAHLPRSGHIATAKLLSLMPDGLREEAISGNFFQASSCCISTVITSPRRLLRIELAWLKKSALCAFSKIIAGASAGNPIPQIDEVGGILIELTGGVGPPKPLAEVAEAGAGCICDIIPGVGGRFGFIGGGGGNGGSGSNSGQDIFDGVGAPPILCFICSHQDEADFAASAGDCMLFDGGGIMGGGPSPNIAGGGDKEGGGAGAGKGGGLFAGSKIAACAADAASAKLMAWWLAI